jgi:hypothetical protein
MFNIPDMGPMGGYGPMAGLGPMGDMTVQGKWINKRTGQVITARDSVIEGDNMVVMTDIGQIDMETFSRDYIQQSDEVYDAPQTQNAPGTSIKEITAEDPTVMAGGVNPLEVPLDQIPQSTVTVHEKQVTIGHYDMIDKIFVKNETEPKIKFEIEWTDFPAKELQMLVDYFDVSIDDISKYISKKFVDQQAIVDSLTSFVNKRVHEK